MTAAVSILTNPVLLWSVLGVILIAAETIAPDFVIFFFGIGAFLTALAAAVFPPLAASPALQGLLWAGSSILTLLLLRRRFSRVFKGTLLNPGETKTIAKTGTVLEAITADTPGRVRYNGTSWKAVSYDQAFQPGETVEILQEEGLTLMVSAPLLEDNNLENNNKE